MTRDRDDAEYWNALAARVTSVAVRQGQSNSLEWLAESRVGWTTTLVLAAVALIFMTPATGQPVGDAGSTSLNIVLPTDAVGKAMSLRDQPPAVGTLLFEAEERRQR